MLPRERKTDSVRVGLISDTHGLLRPEAVAFLRGCDHIIHGGDIGNAAILEALAAIAPVTAVRGNNDRGVWAAALAETAVVNFANVYIYAIHDIARFDLDPHAAGVQVIVSGHSHVPRVLHKDGMLYINPGSAGPRRFRLPVAIGELVLDDGAIESRIVELDERAITGATNSIRRTALTPRDPQHTISGCSTKSR